jgi:hypothetical protein
LDYRLYLLDAQGRVRERVDLECDDDDDAMRMAEARAEGRAAELWRRAVLVREYPGSGPPKGG